MIRSFAAIGSEDIFNGVDSAAARRACPSTLWPAARRKLMRLDAAGGLRDLWSPPGNRLERLRGDRDGQYSIRVNVQYRICFRWEEPDAYEVEVTDYH